MPSGAHGPADLTTYSDRWAGAYGPAASSPLEPLSRRAADAEAVELGMGGLGVKRPGYPALATMEGLQVVKKVKVGEGGTRGRLRSADFDKLYATTIHLAISHYQSILANSTIYPNDIQARDWSGQAWAAACRSQGVQIDYDEDAYKLVSFLHFYCKGWWC
jgi:hypothetical protein